MHVKLKVDRYTIDHNSQQNSETIPSQKNKVIAKIVQQLFLLNTDCYYRITIINKILIVDPLKLL